MVSVIIPVYNGERFLKDCLDSVINQTYQNIEIILIDDGSTDNTVNICAEFVQKDKRIKLINNEHLGVSAARNSGIDMASGKYIFFLDSDDVIHPQLLEALVSGINTTDADIAATSLYSFRTSSFNNIKTLMDKNGDISAIIEYNNHMQSIKSIFSGASPIGMIGGVMITKELIGDTRFKTDIFIGEDFYFIYQNLIKGASSVFLKELWYFNRIHKNNSSWNYGFDGFYTRFLRRKLVWESEEKLGRFENADHQKRDAFRCYTRCLHKNHSNSMEVKRMQKVMIEHKKAILSTLTFKNKMRFYLSVYLPCVYVKIIK